MEYTQTPCLGVSGYLLSALEPSRVVARSRQVIHSLHHIPPCCSRIGTSTTVGRVFLRNHPYQPHGTGIITLGRLEEQSYSTAIGLSEDSEVMMRSKMMMRKHHLDEDGDGEGIDGVGEPRTAVADIFLAVSDNGRLLPNVTIAVGLLTGGLPIPSSSATTLRSCYRLYGGGNRRILR
ncbi:hypothetical protein EVAR_70573_1 [Eumeta japonica]|uniref:Uncharacterized protein n=1 Tax=Eumeta variegata TaxID=151549 RepID=A0A4C1TER4_EUMVA|nr:hypothetical protein EVAR_70573_1 [Eumeta japonica]